MPRFLVLSVNLSLLLFGILLFPVRSLAQSPSITDVRNFDNGIDYTGAVDQSVKINGSNFGSSQGSSTVTFNGTAATVTQWGTSAIYTTVPSGATSGNLVVTVGGVASNAKSFTVIAGPNVVALRNVLNANDYTGAVGQFVKVGGGGYGASQGSSTVTFNGTAVTTITNWTVAAIYTYVPSGATSGNLVVTVGGVASNSISFTVLAGPNILTVRNTSNVDITSGTVGTAVRVTGGGFGTSQGSSTVTFNGTAATVTSWAADRVDAPIPSGATTGNLVVTVGGTASNNFSFTVGPIISSVTPTTGGAGTVVQISGSNFGSSQGTGTVKINGTSVGTATTWQSTYISFTMPASLSSGNLMVTANSLSSSPTSFTVTTTPAVYTVTPTTAGAGDVVQITGCNFGSSQGSNTVKINGTSVGPVTTWQQGYINFTMPTGLANGDLVVRAGSVDSNSTAFAVTQPAITSISPATGAPGLNVNIAGTHLGASQGSVTFNGTAATIYSWNSTQIVATVPAGVTTGNVVATVGGVQTNGSSFTAVTPPGVSASVFPAANGAGWHNMNVTVTFTCTPGGLALSSCSSPQTVSSNGVDQIISGGATDVVGDLAETSVTLDIDKAQPALTISSPEDGSSTSSSSVTVSGTLSDTLSGTSSVTCNGDATTLSGGAFSCSVSLNVGLNLVVIRGTDAAGNVSAANYHLTRTGTLSTATSLQITPADVNMVVGETQQFTVVDQDGRVRTDATWEVDDTDIATLPDEDTPELTAVDTGDITLTATIDSITAEVEVHVLEGTSLTDGTVRWSAPSTSGSYDQQIVHAKLVAGAPDLYFIESGSWGTLVRALKADGRQMWATQFGSGQWATAFPDTNGGVLLRLVPASGDSEQLVSLDAQTGNQAWTYQTERRTSRALAIGSDGTIFDLQQDFNTSLASAISQYEHFVYAVDGATGTPVASYKVPYSKWTNGNCSSSVTYNSGNSASQPVIAPDGTAMVMVMTTERVLVCDTNTRDHTLSLLRMTPDGSITLTDFKEINWATGQGDSPDVEIRRVIPDGEGGALAAWSQTNPLEHRVSHITAGGTINYTLPFTTSGWAPVENMVLGEEGVAYADNFAEIVAFEIASGETIWSYEAWDIHIIASAAEGGLVAKVKDENEADTVVRFDNQGEPTLDEWSGNKLKYDVEGRWSGVSTSTDRLLTYAANPVSLSNAEWYTPDQGGANAAPPIITVDPVTQSGANQTTISDVLLRIENALPSFAVCSNWLRGPVPTPPAQQLTGSAYIQDLRAGNYFAHGTVRRNGRIFFMNGAFVAGAGSGAPVGAAIVVNDVGPFFNQLQDADPNSPFAYGPLRYGGNSASTRIAILIHEVAHAISVPFFHHDGNDADAGRLNDIAVDAHCHGLIAGPTIAALSPNSGTATTTV